jgi:hypothetical protein
MANYRQIHTQIWKDAWFLDLATDEKLVFVYLFSNERASICGLFELAPRVICFETGLERRRVDAIMAKFQKAGKVYCADGLVWVVNLRKYNENNSPKVRAKVNSDLALIPDCQLKRRYLEHNCPVNTISRTLDTISETESEQEQEQEIEQEQEQEIEQEQERVGAIAPSPKRLEQLPHQADVFEKNGGKWPSGKMVDGTPKKQVAIQFMVENVPDDPGSLSFWGQVVHAYQKQWSPKSYTVMVNDYFLRKRIPGAASVTANGNGNGQHVSKYDGMLAYLESLPDGN